MCFQAIPNPLLAHIFHDTCEAHISFQTEFSRNSTASPRTDTNSEINSNLFSSKQLSAGVVLWHEQAAVI